MALNGLKLEVRAADSGQEEAVIYKRIKITEQTQKDEVDDNGNIVGPAPKGYYTLSGGESGSSGSDVFNAVSNHGTLQDPTDDDKQAYDKDKQEVVEDIMLPDPNPTTKQCRRTLNDGTTELINYDIYEYDVEYKFKVNKIQDKAK